MFHKQEGVFQVPQFPLRYSGNSLFKNQGLKSSSIHSSLGSVTHHEAPYQSETEEIVAYRCKRMHTQLNVQVCKLNVTFMVFHMRLMNSTGPMLFKIHCCVLDKLVVLIQ